MIFSRAEHEPKALLPIIAVLLGMLISFKDTQFSNIKSGTSTATIFSNPAISVRATQFLNAFSPKKDIVEGISMTEIETQFSNVLSPILRSPFGNTTSIKLLQFLNVPSIFVATLGSVTLISIVHPSNVPTNSVVGMFSRFLRVERETQFLNAPSPILFTKGPKTNCSSETQFSNALFPIESTTVDIDNPVSPSKFLNALLPIFLTFLESVTNFTSGVSTPNIFFSPLPSIDVTFFGTTI